MQRKPITTILMCVLFFVGAAIGQSDSFWDELLRFFGISANPSQMKAEESEFSGNVWLTVPDDGIQSALTSDGGYRWPIFEHGGRSLLVLHGDDLVRLSLEKREIPPVLYRIANIKKLVGFDRQDADKLLVVIAQPGPLPAILSVRRGQLSSIRGIGGDKYSVMLSHILGQDRTYETSILSVRINTEQRITGIIEWTDVYLQRGDAPAVNVSNGDGTDCCQPALSFDKKMVAYVKKCEE